MFVTCSDSNLNYNITIVVLHLVQVLHQDLLRKIMNSPYNKSFLEPENSYILTGEI